MKKNMKTSFQYLQNEKNLMDGGAYTLRVKYNFTTPFTGRTGLFYTIFFTLEKCCTRV